MTNGTGKPTKTRRGKQGRAGRKPAAPSGGRAKAAASNQQRGRGNGNADPQASFKRYTEMAREAASAGDTVQSEYYYQLADHYHRLIAEG